MFFLGLFMIVGGVEHSQFLEYLGSYITPFVEADLVTATIILMWVGAFLSAAIDNIPFSAAMIPIILGMEQQASTSRRFGGVWPWAWVSAATARTSGRRRTCSSLTISERLARERTTAAWRSRRGSGSGRVLPSC